jgi:RNA polymerase sigma factor (sigma-70 family)
MKVDAEERRVSDDFARLFATQFGPMTRLAALVGSDDPEDTAQEAFTRLERRLGKVDPQSRVAYLRTTVVNLTRSRQRHLSVARRFTAELPLVESAEFSALMGEDRRRVVAALGMLTARQRNVLVLRYWSDLSEREIADTLGVRPGTVKSTAAKALARLATILGDGSARHDEGNAR